jgi:aspartyl-tRNA(Asn)/glutamyl-tRNA(Gln) amidotransferase subunit A
VIHQQSFEALRRAYRCGALSPLDVAESSLAHAARVGDATNAFALIDRERALRSAHASAQRWRAGCPASELDGMPITVKEFALVQGWPTRRGSLTTSDAPAPRSTVFVERLEAGGALLLGKTRAPEFNWKGVTDSPGWGITRNPWQIDLTPGGSSGGCAAAVSAGVVRVSFGSDAGGSVRIPAAFTGILGLKPTHGRIPLWPVPSAYSGTAHAGLLAGSSQDMLEALNVVGGATPLDWTSSDEPAEARAAGELAPQQVRFGLLASRYWDESCAPVKAAMEMVIGALRAEKIALREVDFDVRDAARVGRELYRIGCAQSLRVLSDGLMDLVDPGLLAWAAPAACMDLQHYLALTAQRDAFGEAMAVRFQDVDVLLLPTVPVMAFEAGRNAPLGWPADDWFAWNPYTPTFNILQMPALSYPIRPNGSLLPTGVQLVAARHQDRRLLRIAHWLEARFPIQLSPLASTDARVPSSRL